VECARRANGKDFYVHDGKCTVLDSKIQAGDSLEVSEYGAVTAHGELAVPTHFPSGGKVCFFNRFWKDAS
jgi:hypothetical protein